MSNLHLPRFFNPSNRPTLNDSCVTDIPSDVLGPILSLQLRQSLLIDDRNDVECAVSARFWEDLLEQHRVPYLLLRVADMRMVLGREPTALVLYQELNEVIKNADLGLWINEIVIHLKYRAEADLTKYNEPAFGGFTEEQRWKPTAGVDTFPYCNLEGTRIESIRERWRNLEASDDIKKKYLNLNCIQTNTIEGTFEFDLSSATKLIQVGFYNQVLNINSPRFGEVRDRDTALSILKDTQKALEKIFSFIKPGSDFKLTRGIILNLHAELMQTSRVLCLNTLTNSNGTRLSYISAGLTRQTSAINVTAMEANTDIKIQFCPFNEVDSELDVFCERFNQLIQIVKEEKMDPFAAAAWISHVFITIHPFEDGNGRVSRLLSSIPLLMSMLPPLCVPIEYRKRYIKDLNNMRATRNGDYSSLMETLYGTTNASLDDLDSILLHDE